MKTSTDTPNFAPHHATEARAVEMAGTLIHGICEHGPRPEIAISKDEMPTLALGELLEEILSGRAAGNGWNDVSTEILANHPGERGDRLKATLSDACQAPFAPSGSACIAAREFVQRHHRTRLLWQNDQAINAAVQSGKPLDDLLAERQALQSGTVDKSRSLIVRGVNDYPTDIPPEAVILGNGWLRKGDISTFISTAGAGKSVATTQAAMAWGIGLPYLGIRPPRPLRILLFSGEDDETTIGQIREGLLANSQAVTGRTLTARDLEPLDRNLRTEFSREHVGPRFHAHLSRLLAEEPVDLVIVNPLLSYVGGEIVTCASEFLRGGLMPILQEHECAAMIAHHTGKMAKDGWENTDDTYSAIGGGEMGNIPRSILTLRPTTAEGLFVLKVSKRQTTGWKDSDGKFSSSYFLRRTDDPTRPAWLPVESDEAEGSIAGIKGNGKSKGKMVKMSDVTGPLATGDMQRQALIGWIMTETHCSDKTAIAAINEAEDEKELIQSYTEPNPNGGKAVKWFKLSQRET